MITICNYWLGESTKECGECTHCTIIFPAFNKKFYCENQIQDGNSRKVDNLLSVKEETKTKTKTKNVKN